MERSSRGVILLGVAVVVFLGAKVPQVGVEASVERVEFFLEHPQIPLPGLSQPDTGTN